MTGVNLLPPHYQNEKSKVLLIILDGWGIGTAGESNPIFLANTPVWDALIQRYGYARLEASGEAVGLQSGKAGNSEAGHLNIGAGRVVLQDDVRLDNALNDGSFYQNEIFLKAIEGVKERKPRLHLIGLLTEKSSHGSIDYPLALLKMAHERGVEDVYLHLIFDGRSTEPGSAPALLEKLERSMTDIGIGQIVTGIGRGIALDRDGNYTKIKKAYDAFVRGAGSTIHKEIMSEPSISRDRKAFQKNLYTKMQHVHPGISELEWYEFDYALDNLTPSSAGMLFAVF
jgi:2,3-bisphosphoglycerate-independent phosphoglycerate mutase